MRTKGNHSQKVTGQAKTTISRRKFLRAGAATAAAAAAACSPAAVPQEARDRKVTSPQVSRAETVTLKMQGSWGRRDIFNEMAEDYVTRVNAMAGGRLKIDYLVTGSVVKSFRVHDAVHKGVLDAAHTVTVFWYGKSKVASLFGTGPVFGQNPVQKLGWIHYGGGQELYDELMAKLGFNIVGFFSMPMPAQPLGWFKNPIESAQDLVGLKYRTVGLAADLMQQMGLKVTQLPGGEIVPALERGVIDAFEFNNPTSDRSFGAQDVSKVYMLGSFHQVSDIFEIIFNKDRYASLPEEHQAILKYTAEAAATNNFSKMLDRYSNDLQWLKNKAGVKIYRTPQSVMREQLKAWDKILPRLERDPFFAKVVKSQKAWAKRVAYYELLNAPDYKLAYDHYFPGTLGV